MKKILVAIVAAAMLFAFTACEQEPVDVLGYEPTMVSVTQNGEILDGQPITADMFTGTVTYRNGDTSPVAVVLSADKAATGVTATATVSSSMTATWKVVVTPIESYDVTAEFDDVTVIDTATQSKSFTGKITALTAKGGNSSYEMTDFDDFDVTASLTKEQRTAIGTYSDLELALTKNSTAVKTESTGTIDVVAKADESRDVTGIQAKYTVTREGATAPIAQDVTSLSGLSLFIGDEVTITMYDVATKAGEDDSDTITGFEYVDSKATADITFSGSTATVEVKAAAQGGTAYYRIPDHGTESIAISVPAGKNAVVMEGSVITVNQPSTIAYAAGTLAGGTDITKYVELASGAGLKNLNGEEEVAYTVTVDAKRSYNITETAQTIWVNVNYTSYDGTVSYPTTVPFKAQTV